MNNINYINVVSGLDSNIDNVMLEAVTKDRIILYFGGGLSSNKYIKEQLGPLLLETTFHTSNVPNSHPIIVQWETGIFELDSLKNIANELLGVNNITKIRNWLKRKLGIGVMGFSPAKPKDEVARSMLINVGFTYQDIESDNNTHLSDTEMENRLEQFFIEDGEDLKEGIESIDASINKDGPKMFMSLKSIKTLYLILRRFALKTDHGAYTTIVEELLRFSNIATASPQGHWKNVYQTSEVMWKKGAGKYFLEKLNAHCESKVDVRIDLVSHSAGSIAICHLIDELAKNQYPNIKIGNILPVAPAVRMNLFEKTIVDNETIFDNFTMYTLCDEAELNDKLFHSIYPHSLLYFVSGIAEEEGKADMSILGMHRYFRADGDEPYLGSRYKKENYRKTFGDLEKIRTYLAQDGMVILSPNNINPHTHPGLAADGIGHENTKLPNESPELAKSLIYLLSQGEVNPIDVDTSTWQEAYLKYHS